MTYKTHVAFATAIALPIEKYYFTLEPELIILFYIALIIGALAPDLDEEGSYLSRKIPIIPFLLGMFGVEHRGITHRALGALIVAGLFYLLMVANNFTTEGIVLSVGFVSGYVLHLAGDMLTKGGIRDFFSPLCSCKAVLLPRFLRFYTGSFIEMVIFALLLIVIGLEIVYL